MHFAVAGCGVISRFHLDAIRSIEDAALCGVYDPVEASARAAAQAYGTRAYPDYDALLADPQVDAVCICTPSHLHAPLALQAVAAGKHVLIEKPVALTLEDCDAVAAVTKDDNINLMVAQIARELFGVKHVIARVAEPSRKEVYTERFGLRIVCGTNLTAQGLLAGILQEEDDEDQCVMFGSSTANFSAVPAAKHQWNRPLSSVQPPRAGMMVFGVLRANGTMELANTQPTLHVDDKILFAELAD